ncbi:MAG TPA: LLM class flavin-dependent oxidoreductase, partial [Candidatus Eisenbacteria bacterium]|nr:LLM class flavin-dependent oxidoreductase [Candidatus Eisenbacteria bacterium]
TLLAEHTRHIGLATGIVNTYSRTPGALAQHFATLDELSGGRMIIGLGTSGPQVIEHFHGVPFNPPLTRMREYVEIINRLIAGEPLNYDGKLFRLERGFTLRFEPPRRHIPIWIASLNHKSVEFTAERADGWLPVMIPLSRLGQAIAEFRAAAARAGRAPGAVAVKAPGTIHVTANPERARAQQAGTLSFYAARMGAFYAEQLTRFGFADDVRRVREAWAAGGSKAGSEAVSRRLLDEMGYVGDVAGARERLTRLAREVAAEDAAAQAQVLGRLAWAQTLDAAPDSARSVFLRTGGALASSSEWRYRMARAFAPADPRRTVDLLLPNAVRSRGTDREVMQMLREAARRGGVEQRLDATIGAEVAARDAREKRLLAALGARRVRLPASDGFALSGVLFEPRPMRRHAPAVVVLVSPADTIAAYDSLATRLAGHGLPTLLLDVRGSGWSVDASCPTPEAWVGREDAMHDRTALDVRDAIAALAVECGADSTRAVVVGAGAMATDAVEAAERDRHVRALLLVSPNPAPADRAVTAWRLGRLQLPVFFQTAPEDYDVTLEITEALYQAGNRAQSRQVDASVPGHGVAVFRADPELAGRFLDWLDAAWRATPGTPGSPGSPGSKTSARRRG